MRFILSLMTLVGLFLTAGCNPVGCILEQKVVDGASGFVSTTLQCANQDVVKADLTKLVQALAPNLCSSAPQGPLANTLCPVLANSVVDYLALNGVPAAWGCSVANVSALAKDKLTALCEQLPL